MNLEFVVNKFTEEKWVSVIGDFKLCETLVEELEELGYTFGEEEFATLCDKNNKVFIISRCENDLYIESFYNDKNEPLWVENDYIFVQHGLLSDEELSKIHAYKERIHLVVYNI